MKNRNTIRHTARLPTQEAKHNLIPTGHRSHRSPHLITFLQIFSLHRPVPRDQNPMISAHHQESRARTQLNDSTDLGRWVAGWSENTLVWVMETALWRQATSKPGCHRLTVLLDSRLWNLQIVWDVSRSSFFFYDPILDRGYISSGLTYNEVCFTCHTPHLVLLRRVNDLRDVSIGRHHLGIVQTTS